MILKDSSKRMAWTGDSAARYDAIRRFYSKVYPCKDAKKQKTEPLGLLKYSAAVKPPDEEADAYKEIP